MLLVTAKLLKCGDIIVEIIKKGKSYKAWLLKNVDHNGIFMVALVKALIY